jgi:aminopeptidase N
MATTFSAAAYARKIFPCFDEPAFKAEFRLAISNRNNTIALANTKVSGVETQEL